jgi:linoleoyl-CoA desaturase
VVATYLPRSEFARQLEASVAAYFTSTGERRRDVPRMYLKTAVMLTWLFGSYATLVFVASSAWLAVPAAISLGLAMAGVGFNIQHDGNHGAYSSRPWINKVMSLTLDLLGGTAYFWHFKHNIAHHTHPNVHGHDDDISMGVLGRLSPHQRWYPPHRFQHIYVWALYALFAVEWQLTGEFRNLIGKRSVGTTRVPFPPAHEQLIFWVGKLVFFGLAFGLPLALHPVSAVIACYLLATVTLGLVLATVFQLAHCTEPAEFRAVSAGCTTVPRPWAEHQIDATVDFARNNRLVTWYLGGLNLQIEHHLFPRICHVHYPALAPIVESVCRANGVPYRAFPSVRAALLSHVRWLRRMGHPPEPQQA